MNLKDRYKFSIEFVDYEAGGRRFEITQPPTKDKDAGFFRAWLCGMEEHSPEFAQYIVDTARLIVEANQRSNT